MNAANRLLWTVLGIVLTALGVLGVLVHLGRLPGTYSRSPLLWPELTAWWRQHGGWLTLAVVVAGLLLAFLGYLLLRAQLRPRRHLPDVVVDNHSDAAVPGVTRVRYHALADSFAADLSRQRGVHKAKVLLDGDSHTPHVTVDLTARPAADLGVLQAGLDRALRRFTVTTGATPSRVQVNTTMDDAAARVA